MSRTPRENPQEKYPKYEEMTRRTYAAANSFIMDKPRDEQI
jgi:hypothetical protein